MDFNWLSIHKFIFAIKRKNIIQYLNVFLSNAFSKHFSRYLFDLIMIHANLFHIALHKKPKLPNTITQMVITFSNYILNKINFTSVINDKKKETSSLKIFTEKEYLNIQLLLTSRFLTTIHFQKKIWLLILFHVNAMNPIEKSLLIMVMDI